MNCHACKMQFPVFMQKRACCECKRFHCGMCLVTHKGRIYCDRCYSLMEKMLVRNNLQNWKVKQLVSILNANDISTVGCVEKDELVGLILKHFHTTLASADSDSESEAEPSSDGEVYSAVAGCSRKINGTEQQQKAVPPINPNLNDSNNEKNLNEAADDDDSSDAPVGHFERNGSTPPKTYSRTTGQQSSGGKGRNKRGGPVPKYGRLKHCLRARANGNNATAPATVRKRTAPATVQKRTPPATAAAATHRPGPASVTQRPGPASVTQRPGPASVTQRPGPASVTQRPGPASVTQRTASATVTQRSVPATVTQRAVPASVRQRRFPLGPGRILPATITHCTGPDGIPLPYYILYNHPDSIAGDLRNYDLSSDESDTGTEYEVVEEPSDNGEAAALRERQRKYADLSKYQDPNEFDELSCKQLKEMLKWNRVDFKGCCEKSELLERVKRLWKEQIRSMYIDKLPESSVCKVCMDAPIECVILECGHLATCTNCGAAQRECPICRQFIVRIVRFFKS